MKLKLILFHGKRKQKVLERCQGDSLGTLTQINGC